MAKFQNKKSGFLLIDKPVGWTSFDVCGKLRKELDIKRVGHTGTLDPFATGLLVVALGKATKLIQFLDKEKKTYVAKVLLGKTSETLDMDSEVTELDKNFEISKPEIEKIMAEKFSGKISQIPPKYSALKIKGKKMCDLVRAGKEFEVKAREAEVLDWKILAVDNAEKSVELEITVAAGFYVRSFARDLGEIFNSSGVCAELRRTQVGEFLVDDALDVETIGVDHDLTDVRNVLTSIDNLVIIPQREPDFVAGRAFPVPDIQNGTRVFVTCQDKTIGLAEIVDNNLQPRIVF